MMLRANEKREMRLRDEFSIGALRNAQLRIEALEGNGRVDVSAVDEYGRALRPVPDATTSSRRRAIRSAPPPRPASRTLIDQAEASGTINSETALLYRVYDIFSDARLPQQYRGDDSEIFEGMYLPEVVNRYPELSAATQAAVAPFLMPPIYKTSWASAQQAVPGVSDFTPPICSGLNETWSSVGTSNGFVRIWYKLTSPDLGRAIAISAAIDNTIWTKLAGLMKNHVPYSDIAVPTCNGGDGRLDLYITDTVRSEIVPYLGVALPYSGCQNTPVFIEVGRTVSDATVIHEIMHAFQFSYPLKACMTDRAYQWWTEGSAMFAQDFVDPPSKDEHAWAKWFLDHPNETLDFADGRHEYGAYLLPYYAYRSTSNADFVSATWEKCASEPAVDAFDHSVAGGFDKVWFDFVRFNFNSEAFDQYTRWDGMPHKVPERQLIFSGGEDIADPINVELPRLSPAYRYYVFGDDEWNSVAFCNGVTFNLKLREPAPGAGVQYVPEAGDADAIKGARVQALIKRGGNWTHEDWTKRPYAAFCRDMTAERIEALVIIISNSDLDRDHRVRSGGGELPLVYMSNMGCWQWKGTVTYSNPMGVNIATNATWTRTEQSQEPPFTRYQAKGTQSWNFAGVCSGSGTLPIPPELSLMFTYNYSPSQSDFHRVVNAIGASTSPVLINCPPAPMPVQTGLPSVAAGWEDWTKFEPQVLAVRGARSSHLVLDPADVTRQGACSQNRMKLRVRCNHRAFLREGRREIQTVVDAPIELDGELERGTKQS